MISTTSQIEEFNRLTPLGLRFWDTLSGNSIGDGLSITACPVNDPTRQAKAISNRSGVYMLQDLPGLHEIEFGKMDITFWSNVSKKPFAVQVIDSQERFQPFTFQVDLPYQGIFTDPCALMSPPLESSNYPGIPLYSAVTRKIPAGMAVIYVHLWDASNDEPASWAMLEASFDGQLLAHGFADRQGRLALPFPYPEPLHSISAPLDSPPTGNRTALVDQAWPIQLQSFYTPQHPSPEIPDLCQTLNQLPTTLLSTLSPALPLGNVMLHYGRELVVRSKSQSFVWIVP